MFGAVQHIENEVLAKVDGVTFDTTFKFFGLPVLGKLRMSSATRMVAEQKNFSKVPE